MPVLIQRVHPMAIMTRLAHHWKTMALDLLSNWGGGFMGMRSVKRPVMMPMPW